jgi:hypothetical protein
VNRVQRNVARHYQRLAASAAVTVTYGRGGQSVELQAVPAETAVRVEDAEGLSVRAKRRDWIVTAADLVIGGQVILPEAGDTIRVAVGDPPDQEIQVFEVQRLVGESHYYACDDEGRVLRVHARHVDTEAGES